MGSPDPLIWTFADGGDWAFGRTRIIGILNVTPDSFSDGGRHLEPEIALARALEMVEEGADAIDVGGESTRPGSLPVTAEEEARRVVPVIRALRDHLDRMIQGGGAPREHVGDRDRDPSQFDSGGRDADGGATTPRDRMRISIDTSKAAVAAAALDAGADIVNDVTALQGDPAMAPLLARRGAAAILMHMRGTPRTMQDDPRYDDVMGEIAKELRASLEAAVRAGIAGDRIVLDPGIGFGKTAGHNLEILARLPLLAALGRPLLVGVSRKSFLGKVTGLPVDRRLEAGLAAGAAAILNGASLLRVHDVAPTISMARVIDAIRAAGLSAGRSPAEVKE